jgi:hypothetical protein
LSRQGRQERQGKTIPKKINIQTITNLNVSPSFRDRMVFRDWSVINI